MNRRNSALPPRLAALAAGLCLLAGSVQAAGPVSAGKVISDDGTVLQRPAGKKLFEPLKKGADVVVGELTLGVHGSEIDSADGAVQMRLLTDLEGISPYPILEAVVNFKEPEKGVSFDFALDRGRVVVENKKEKARVLVHVRDQTWELILNEPGTKVGVELFGRWPRGIFWEKNSKTPESPTAIFTLLVLKGSAELKHGKHVHEMTAPPGAALFHWDSAGGEDSGPKRLEELPVWAKKPEETPEYKAKLATLAEFRAGVLKNGLEAATAEALKSPKPEIRRIAVVAMGANDNLEGLIAALSNEKHDVRDEAVAALRHWIGRCPGQDEKLYEALQKDKKYTEKQADIILFLLHTPGGAQLTDSGFWEKLLAALTYEKIAVRELAEYHLYRLMAEEGKKIKYDSAGSKAELEAAYKEWKKVIPDDTVPEKYRPKKEK